MFYTVYKITNSLNGKYYIGMHETKNLDDGYMGSGKVLKLAIKKYGLENFTKEILHIFDNEDDMRNKEKELVVLNEMCYNLCDGGKGGFGYINRSGLNISGVSNRDYKQISEKVKATKKSNPYHHTDDTKRKISEANVLSNKSRGMKTSQALKGKPKTEEHKRKIAEAVRRRHAINAGVV